jgi:hypothetical protein
MEAATARLRESAFLPLSVLANVTEQHNAMRQALRAASVDLSRFDIPALDSALRSRISDASVQASLAHALREDLTVWEKEYGRTALDDFAKGVAEGVVSAPPDASIAGVVLGAVKRHLRSSPKKINWYFVVPLVLGAFYFLFQLRLNELRAQINEEELQAIRAEQRAIRGMLEAISIRETVRPTRLMARAAEDSRVLIELERAEIVRVLESTGLWSRVTLMTGADGMSRYGVGWVRTKDLRFMQ